MVIMDRLPDTRPISARLPMLLLPYALRQTGDFPPMRVRHIVALELLGLDDNALSRVARLVAELRGRGAPVPPAFDSDPEPLAVLDAYRHAIAEHVWPWDPPLCMAAAADPAVDHAAAARRRPGAR